MRPKLLLVTLAVVAAACGTGDGSSAAFTEGDVGQARTLAYAYQPDSNLTYDFSMSVAMDMAADLPAAPGLGGFGDISMAMSTAGQMGYVIADGPDAGTVQVTVKPAFDSFDVDKLTLDGESLLGTLTSADLLELTGTEDLIPEISVLMDERGNMLELLYGGVAVPTDLFGGFGGATDPTGFSTFGAFFGPAFPEEQLRVGGEWTTHLDRDIPIFGKLEATVVHRVVDEETVAGRETIVIESATSMDAVSLTLDDMLKWFDGLDASSLDALGISGADLAGINALDTLGIDFEMSMVFDVITAKTWFDPEAGLMARTASNAIADMSIAMKTPEGDADMDISMSFDIDSQLVDGGVA